VIAIKDVFRRLALGAALAAAAGAHAQAPVEIKVS